MGDATLEFFSRLGERRPPGLSPKVSGTILVNLTNSDTPHWFLDIGNGIVRVSREERTADLVIEMDKALLDRLTVGEEQVHAAHFRNEMAVAGNLRLLSVFRKLLPGPAGARDPGRARNDVGIRQ